MTLPQYLDPFTSESQDGTDSQQADNAAITVAVKYGRLPYTKLQGMVFHIWKYLSSWFGLILICPLCFHEHPNGDTSQSHYEFVDLLWDYNDPLLQTEKVNIWIVYG